MKLFKAIDKPRTRDLSEYAPKDFYNLILIQIKLEMLLDLVEK